ncbi:hypothetical protein A9Q84_16810 [Halobacteriovorax marinus]|uniref:Periplasmic binding protein domain-containing protein n=1 Tax=Halobacteriovorax marinus TaxID=97084 RepID=A0A1Y5F4I9_9BACT|nr:hypothetical protein A9Q84_16810 [Halobacteriovorax marinus]
MNKLILIALFFLNSSIYTQEKIYRFGVVAKDTNLPFFQLVKEGCLKRARELENVECIFVEVRAARPKIQEREIKRLVKMGVNGIAISVINSDSTRKTIESFIPSNIPVVTFDSDLTKEVLSFNPKIRKAYIGTNNYDLGYKLAELMIKSSPEPREFCLISGYRYSDNLNLRIKGFLEYMSKQGNQYYRMNLDCPIYSIENFQITLNHLIRSLNFKTSDGLVPTIVVMGSWPQENANVYMNSVDQFFRKNRKSNVSVFAIDTIDSQITLLEKGYSAGNVGQRPRDMGAWVLDILLDINLGREVRTNNYTGLTLCTPSNYETCRD